MFERDFLSVDNSFDAAEMREARGRLAELKKNADRLTDAQFELAVAEIAALSHNGHSGVYLGRWPLAFSRLAVRFLLTDEGLYVADAAPAYEALVGSRVVRIEGHDVDALRSAWARYYARTRSGRDEAMHLFLESPELLHAAGLAASPDSVRLELAGGRTIDVGTSSAWPAPEGIWRFLPDARLLELAAAGRVDGNPLSLREPDELFRLVELPARDAVYVQFRANHYFDGGGDMRSEAAEAIARLRALSPRFVIVDQRFNLGGDLNNTRDLMQAIPDIVGPEGRVVAITSGRTFSAGIASLGYLKQAGGDRVTIVGAPVGDELEFWAEGSPVILPNSGIAVGVATERHNYMTGCPEPDCHGPIQRHPIRVQSLQPDVRPKLRYADVVGGTDAYLDAALALIDEK
ncbi:MAG: hypothetical protein PVF05_06845 [Gemmatimonadales bacterium]|jgi:hypothetical protein